MLALGGCADDFFWKRVHCNLLRVSMPDTDSRRGLRSDGYACLDGLLAAASATGRQILMRLAVQEQPHMCMDKLGSPFNKSGTFA
jgi:hypothetical protein